MKRHADCMCNPLHDDATDSTRLWPADGTLTDQQTVVARLLGMTVRGGRVRASRAGWATVQAVVGLIEEGRGKPLSGAVAASEGRDGVRGGSQGALGAPEGTERVDERWSA